MGTSVKKTTMWDKIRLFVLFVPMLTTPLAIMQGDTTLAPHIVSRILSYVNWACFLISLPFIRNIAKDNIPIILVASIYFVLNNFHRDGNISIEGVLMTLLLFRFAFVSREDLLKMMRWFRVYLVIMSVLGLVAYLDFFVGIGLPHERVEYYAMSHEAAYVNYRFAYIYVPYDEVSVRLCGMFNEPGYFGTMLALCLLVERMNLKRWGNIAMLLAGMCTLSFAFFMLVIVGTLLMSIRRAKSVLAVIAVAVVVALMIPYLQSENEAIGHLTDRFAFDQSTGRLQGDNRRGEVFQSIEQEFERSDKKAFGFGTDYCSHRFISNTLTYKTKVVEWGWIGFAITYGMLVLHGFLRTKRRWLAMVYVFCFAISIYQRPNIFNYSYFLMLYGGIELMLDAQRQREQQLRVRTMPAVAN